MAQTTNRTGPWAAILLGGLALVLIVAGWSAWRATEGAGSRLRLSLAAPRASDLPVPRLPDAPRLPDPPIPVPK